MESEVLCAATAVLRILAESRSGDSMSEAPNRCMPMLLLGVDCVLR
jgi:hypothetical protein